MAVKRVKLNSPDEVEGLRSIGVAVHLGMRLYGGEWYQTEVGWRDETTRRGWDKDHRAGRYYFIEVEDSDE